jgi:hypothetical protein
MKDDIEEHGEALGVAVASALTGLVSRSDELSRDLFLDSISSELSAMLGGSLRARVNGSRHGSIEPKGGSNQRIPKPKGEGGSHGAGGVAKIVPANLGDVIAGVRKQMSGGKPIYFIDVNKARPDVEEALARNDRTAITILAIAVLSDFLSNEKERDVLQGRLRGIEDDSKSDAFRRIFGNWFHYGIKKPTKP